MNSNLLIILFLSSCKAPVSNNYSKVYEISEFLNEQQYDQYMNDDGSIFHRLLNYKTKLSDSNIFNFYPFANNFIEIINEDIPRTCMVNYGTDYEDNSIYEFNKERGIASEAIQIEKNFFELFPIKLLEGRLFEDDDFNYYNTIKVLMGYAYKDYFKLGDSIKGYYIGEYKTFKIIGFIQNTYSFYNPSTSQMASYDNYIVMPFQKINEDSFSSRAILLQEIGGFILSDNNTDHISSEIDKYLDEYDLSDLKGSIVVNNRSIDSKLSFVD